MSWDGPPMRVLVIEDYSPLRLAIVKGLQDAGVSVDACVNGRNGPWQAEPGSQRRPAVPFVCSNLRARIPHYEFALQMI